MVSSSNIRRITLQVQLVPKTIEWLAWNVSSVECTRRMAPKSKIVFFGINTMEDYFTAAELGADAVYSDFPRRIVRSLEAAACIL